MMIRFVAVVSLLGSASSFLTNTKPKVAFTGTTELNSAAGALALAQVFGLPTNIKDAADYVKNFDFSKISVTDTSAEDYLNIGLAPSYGTLTSDAVKTMDDELKVMIAGTTKAIARLSNRSWANVISSLQQNPLLEPMDQGTEKTEKLIKDYGTSAFKFDGSADAAIVREVDVWFKSLIADEDIINSSGIDIDVLAAIVAQTGATIDSFETFFAKKERHEKTMIEIGVLRYPDIDNPFFKVYRIKLVAWSDSSRIIFIESNKNGITGEFAVRRYKPRASVIANLQSETKAKAIQEAEDLFA